ncbi:hypothetical protein PVK06_013103 [Gossypium arboreum]|uniref:Uncharacterized protein n=1 Tax=Gossypium arboreum TaxID=29729 RepID=A0ABR0QEM7_GOSAR|nr:hypothetical protein PVK06_013103 [Gossypium arboreum]
MVFAPSRPFSKQVYRAQTLKILEYATAAPKGRTCTSSFPGMASTSPSRQFSFASSKSKLKGNFEAKKQFFEARERWLPFVVADQCLKERT